MEIDFWNNHDFVFVLCMFFFPRLTMLLGTSVCKGAEPIFWIGWLFFPRFTVAMIATYLYGHSNTFLVGLTWIWAINLEVIEKREVKNRFYAD
ncbi:MAG: hypothetical protein E6Q36_02740 [Chryseobacterium sp.]|nr:MAG: hypothetical protein E6Q36_02740 [Chryseobacterium sp.]